MRTIRFLNLLLACVLSLSLIMAFKVIWEDDDASWEVFCNTAASFGSEDILAGILSCMGIFGDRREVILPAKSFMAYRERLEKSPPGFLDLSVIA